MEDWEALEAKMVLVEMGTEQEMADVLVEAIDEVQEVQEGLESVRTLLGSVREVPLAQAGAEPVQEVPEVQDHPSRLPPDLAALAHPEHPRASPRQCLWGRGCPPGRVEGQRR